MINVVLIGGKKFIIVSDLYSGDGELLGSYNSLGEACDAHPDASKDIKEFIGDAFCGNADEPTE